MLFCYFISKLSYTKSWKCSNDIHLYLASDSSIIFLIRSKINRKLSKFILSNPVTLFKIFSANFIFDRAKFVFGFFSSLMICTFLLLLPSMILILFSPQDFLLEFLFPHQCNNAQYRLTVCTLYEEVPEEQKKKHYCPSLYRKAPLLCPKIFLFFHRHGLL